MSDANKLFLVKSVHTLIWVFFNVVIFYFVYAVVVDQIDKWVWICLGLIAMEALTLVAFKIVCPVTLLARRYSDSTKDNFDIFLPNWLARYNKQIYSAIVLVGILILFYRLFT
jgi:hypothetical protein